MAWALWWVWAIAALVLIGLEVVVPGFILLGFAIGAGVVALILLIGGPMSLALTSSLPLLLAVFAAVSLIAWICLRRFLGRRTGPKRTWSRDINDD
ncbi:MAG: hypothetical protein AAGJ96_04125 [Pseudomonadota bacterium]